MRRLFRHGCECLYTGTQTRRSVSFFVEFPPFALAAATSTRAVRTKKRRSFHVFILSNVNTSGRENRLRASLVQLLKHLGTKRGSARAVIVSLFQPRSMVFWNPVRNSRTCSFESYVGGPDPTVYRPDPTAPRPRSRKPIRDFGPSPRFSLSCHKIGHHH